MVSSGGKQHEFVVSSDLFVGRGRSLEVIKVAVDEALRGRGSLVLVSGEAGIGKTRLAEEAAAYAATRNVTVLWASCWKDSGSPPFWPWIQILRAYQDVHGRRALVEDLGEGALDVMAIMQLGGRVPTLEHVGDPEQVRFRMFDSFTSFLVSATRRQPLLVVVDDMHLADVASLALLRFLVPRLRTAKGVVVATYREPHDGPDAVVPAQLSLGARATSVTLSGLRREELGQLPWRLSGDQANARIVEWMHAQTAGNPYFAKELFRLLRSRGLADPREPPPERISVPEVSVTWCVPGWRCCPPKQPTCWLRPQYWSGVRPRHAASAWRYFAARIGKHGQ